MELMLQKILVPLDGSELAEAAIPYVKEISRRCEPLEVVLLQVVRLPQGRSAPAYKRQDTEFPVLMPDSAAHLEAARYPIYRDQEIESTRAEVEAALTPMAQKLRGDGISVRIAVAFGRPAQEIVDFAEREDIDLIVMSTHGRSGMSRWILGSVADKVLRGTHLPVLLVRPPGIAGPAFPPQPEIEL
jgi:nucleotide-binding universal stress UspA family protein